MNKFPETKQKIEDWIGNSGSWLDDLTDEQAEKINEYLEENDINIECLEDINKVAEFVNALIFQEG